MEIKKTRANGAGVKADNDTSPSKRKQVMLNADNESVLLAKIKKTRANGAGVKADDGASQLNRKQVMLDADSEKVLLAIGAGNLSLGIREAARRMVDINDVQAFSTQRHSQRIVKVK